MGPLGIQDKDHTIVTYNPGQTVNLEEKDAAPLVAEKFLEFVSVAPAPTPDPTPEPKPEKININTATIDQITKLPGIGAAIAKKIVGGRPYTSIDDVKSASGLSDTAFEDLKALVEI